MKSSNLRFAGLCRGWEASWRKGEEGEGTFWGFSGRGEEESEENQYRAERVGLRSFPTQTRHLNFSIDPPMLSANVGGSIAFDASRRSLSFVFFGFFLWSKVLIESVETIRQSRRYLSIQKSSSTYEYAATKP